MNKGTADAKQTDRINLLNSSISENHHATPAQSRMLPSSASATHSSEVLRNALTEALGIAEDIAREGIIAEDEEAQTSQGEKDSKVNDDFSKNAKKQ
jgi:hypothetical protein